MHPLIRSRTTAAGIVAAVAALLLLPVAIARQDEAEEPDPVAPPVEDSQPKGSSLTSSMSADSGVSVQTLCTNCNNADLSISGMGNEHVEVVCDGAPVPSGLAQIYLLSVMPPTRIDKVGIRKGAGDPGYLGAAVGGGIEIERTEPEEGFKLNVSGDSGSYGWNAGRLDFSGKTGWFGGFGAITWSESDKINANDDVDDLGRDSADLPEFERTTLEAGIEMTPGESNEIRIGWSKYSEDQFDGPAAAFYFDRRTCVGLDQVIFADEPCTEDADAVGYERENVQLERSQYEVLYDLSIGSGTTLSVTGMRSDRSQDIQETNTPRQFSINLLSDDEIQFVEENFGVTIDELAELGLPIGPPDLTLQYLPAYLIDDKNHHAAITLSQSIGQQSTLRAGASSTGSEFDVVDVRLNESRIEKQEWNVSLDTKLEEDMTETGFWVEGDTAIGSRLELSAGARYVDYSYDDNEEEINGLVGGTREEWLKLAEPEGSDWVPRAALMWKVTDDLQLRWSAGKGYRAPSPAFDKVCCGRQYRGNRGVLLEESKSIGFEVQYQPGPRWRVGGSAFRTDFDNLILNMATDSDRGTHTYQNVNIRDARNTSYSVDGRVQWPNWLTTSLSYTWLDPENRAPEEGISVLKDTGSPIPVPETLLYDEIPYTTDARAALGFAFRMPLQITLSLTGSFTGETWIQRFNEAGVDPELSEAEDFWIVNARVNKQFRNGIALYVGVDNLTDYVQGDGCVLDEALENPGEVGCLGDPRYDYNWGPLRGIYYYGGLGYTFDD